MIWFGLIAPLAVSESRPASEIAIDPITAMTVFRGATPILCLISGLLLLRPRLRIQSLPEGLAIAFATVAVLSTVWSISPLSTLLKSVVLAASYGLVVVLVRTWDSVAEGIADLATAAQLLVISALVGAMLATERAFPAIGWEGQVVRLHGIFPEVHPVPLGTLALVALLTASVGIGRWQWQTKMTVRVILATLSMSALILTQTRAAIILMPFATVLYLIMRGRVRIAALLSLAGVALAVSVLIVPPLRSAFTEAVLRNQGTSEITTLGGRLPMWDVALDTWLDRPLIGYGYYAGHRFGPYPRALAAMDSRRSAESAYIDGAYIETMLDLGIVGLGVLTLLMVSGARALIQHLQGPTHGACASKVAAVATPVAMVLVADSILSYSLQTPSYQGYTLLALVLCLALPLTTNERNDST